MSAQGRFVRKIIYIVIIVVLLLPLSYLSQPSTDRTDSGDGGKLAQVRAKHHLSQAKLGKIDPTSATMRFATLGLHGVAANILWDQAIKSKAREDWTAFNVCLEQIANLQPHFVEVWKFQAWNVAFNISVRFDDYRDSYKYVVRGMKLLQRGIGYNDGESRLPRDLAMFTGFKIGRGDKRDLYRPLFAKDDEYHHPPPEEDWLRDTEFKGIRQLDIRDNWRLSHWWYNRVNELVDNRHINLKKSNKRLTEVVFFANAPRALIEYASTLQREGKFGPVSQAAWVEAGEHWRKFGERPIETSHGFRLPLLDHDLYRYRAVQAMKELIQRHPAGLKARLEKYQARLPEAMAAAMDKLVKSKELSDLSPKEQKLAFAAIRRVIPDPRAMAEEIEDPKTAIEADKLADKYEIALQRTRVIARARDIVAYEAWRVRCEVERKPEVIAARQAIYQGNQLYSSAKHKEALEKYKEAIAKWKVILTDYPELLAERDNLEELMEMIHKYRELLTQSELPFPNPFDLDMVIESFGKQDL